MTIDPRRELEHHFRAQQRFAEGYSPLYAHLFGIVAGWLAGEGDDPLVEWLLAAAAGRAPFDVTLLLPAALHRDVLAGEPAAAELAPYYLTANLTTNDERRTTNEEETSQSDLPFSPSPFLPFSHALRATILAHAAAYAAFIARATVQTNETARGVAWLLPVACLGWPAIHLVELGASAGLNLVAERRGYRLVDAAAPERVLLALGDGPPQFTMTSSIETNFFGKTRLPVPRVLSRTGGDIHPFHMRDTADELTLASYVWGDQPARLARLREGIAALRAAEQTAAPVRLLPLRLPDELPAFLLQIDELLTQPTNRGMNPVAGRGAPACAPEADRLPPGADMPARADTSPDGADTSPDGADTQVCPYQYSGRGTYPPQPDSAGFRVPAAGFNPPQPAPAAAPAAPIVLYNTIMTMYLPDRGASLRGMVAEWAARQPVPVLWLQWEPAWDGPAPPHRDWSAWTAGYWPNDGSGAAYQWQLGWVHPHGTAVEWGDGLAKFLSNIVQT